MTRRTAALALAAALLLLGHVAGPAWAGAPGRVLADASPSPAVADADTIAVVARPGAVRILDARGDERALLPIGEGCLEPPTAVGPIGGGQLVFTCTVDHAFPLGTFPSGEPRLLDLATHDVRIPAGAAEALHAAQAEPLGSGSFDAVGAYGLWFGSSYYHATVADQGIDWRTGAHVSEPGADAVLDMDSPRLVTSLCAPLRRQPFDLPHDRSIDPRPPFDPLVYAPPYALAAGPRSPLTLQRCGDANPRVLERPSQERQVGDMRLVPGLATWRLADSFGPPTALRGYLIACDVLLDWQAGGSTQAVATRSALVLSEPVDSHAWRIRRILLGGICRGTQAAWTLTAANGPRSVRARARTATLGLPNRDAIATLPRWRRGGVARLAVRAGTRIRLAPGSAAHTVRWRVETGRWHRLRRDGGWRLAVPTTVATAPRTLTLDVRYRQGGAARFALRLVSRG